MEYIESKIALANKLRAYREKKGLSQVHLANNYQVQPIEGCKDGIR